MDGSVSKTNIIRYDWRMISKHKNVDEQFPRILFKGTQPFSRDLLLKGTWQQQN